MILITPYNSIEMGHLPLYYPVLCLFYRYLLFLKEFCTKYIITCCFWTRLTYENLTSTSLLLSLYLLYLLLVYITLLFIMFCYNFYPY